MLSQHAWVWRSTLTLVDPPVAASTLEDDDLR